MSEDQALLTCRKLIIMVDELHKLGYELLRLNPSMSPSGLHWRCDIKPFNKKNIEADYSSVQGSDIFNWEDTINDSPLELAQKFISRFSVLIKYSKGSDKDYIEWYSQMVEDTEPMGLIFGFADYPLEDGKMGLLNCKENIIITRPPTGENA